jgi:hypothetical protein
MSSDTGSCPVMGNGTPASDYCTTHLATGIILSARDRLRQKPAPPVANQKEIFCCKQNKNMRLPRDVTDCAACACACRHEGAACRTHSLEAGTPRGARLPTDSLALTLAPAIQQVSQCRSDILKWKT